MRLPGFDLVKEHYGGHDAVILIEFSTVSSVLGIKRSFLHTAAGLSLGPTPTPSLQTCVFDFEVTS